MSLQLEAGARVARSLGLAWVMENATLARTMPLLRCFSSLGCPELSLDAVLALAGKHGLGAVELRALGGSMDLAAYFKAHYETPRALAERLQRESVRVVALDASWRLIGGTDTDRAQLLELAAWADGAGVRWLRIFDGGKDGGAAEMQAASAALAWWKAERAGRGWRVDVMVETHDSLFTAEAIGRFLALAPGTPILWDAHHTWRKGGEDPLKTWRAIRGSVAHVHVKDSVPVPSARHPYTYVLPGEGGFPARDLCAALERDGFAGPVSFEWEKMWHPYLGSLDEALGVAAARRWW